MATATLGGVIAAARNLSPPDPDADLLRRFVATRDDDAFARLVSRYGRLVLSACRRIVPDAHLAEDAFQATFVVLANKARSLDGTRPLGPWLYTVACHVATRARAMIGRRRKRETLTGTVPDVPAPRGTGFPACADESAAILDEEIGKLSPAYREAVVLCELQGLTRKEAAAKLGIAEGTLSSRLAAARKRLADRLTARGVAAVVAPAVFVPADLLAATVAASTGKVELSTHITTLVKGGMTMTFLAKLKLAPVLVALGLLAVVAGGWGGAPGDTATAAPVPKTGKDDGLIWTHHTQTNVLTAYTPDGKVAKVVKLPAGAKFVGLMPDGARMMFVGMKGKLPLPDADGPLTLHVGDIDAKCAGTDTGLGWQQYDEFVWSPDGQQVVRSRRVANGERPLLTFEHTLFDLATKKETPVELPARHQLMQWSADGATWRVMHYNRADDPKLPTYRWLSMPAGGGDRTPICDDAAFQWLDPHPDGKRVLVAPVRPADVTPGAFTLGSVADGKMERLADVPADVDGVVCADARWSPDGTRMAALWYGIGTERQRLGDTLLAVFDGDGKDKKTLLTVKADGQRTRFLGWFPATPKAAPAPRRNAPVPAAKPKPNYFPHEKGTTWVYEQPPANPGGPKTVLVKEVTGATADGKDTLVTVSQWYATDPPSPGGPGPVEEVTFRVTADGDVFRVKIGKVEVNPPQHLVRAALKETDEWPFLTGDAQSKTTFRSEKAEELTVPAGTYSAVPVRMFADGKPTANVTHFADGVGAVKASGYSLAEFKPGKRK